MQASQTFACGNCGSKLYRMTDTVHFVYICWRCGSYGFYPKREDNLEALIEWNPTLLFDMIKIGTMKPIE